MARTANAAKLAQWQERLTRWRQTNLSVAEFCRRERVSQPLFYQWRRRLQPRSADTLTPRFVELPMPARPTSGVQLTLPGGTIVTLPNHASIELVTAVIRAAMQPPRASESC